MLRSLFVVVVVVLVVIFAAACIDFASEYTHTHTHRHEFVLLLFLHVCFWPFFLRIVSAFVFALSGWLCVCAFECVCVSLFACKLLLLPASFWLCFFAGCVREKINKFLFDFHVRVSCTAVAWLTLLSLSPSIRLAFCFAPLPWQPILSM